jgi:uncharacterized Zn-binding protein involved in type VI secretion
MSQAAREKDTTKCVLWIPPHWGGPLRPALPVCVRANGVPVARLADFADCSWNTVDVVSQGASLVLVCGLPSARLGDHTLHGASIIVGSPDVEVGGPTFTLPANLTVTGGADFQNKVIRDLFVLSTTPTGQEVLNQIAKAGQSVEIVEGTDPHNAACIGDRGEDETTACSSTVVYNPDVALFVHDDSGNPIPQPPQVALGHELVHAMQFSEGGARDDEDDQRTIGFGNHRDSSPSENSLRKDLGLPRRGDHGMRTFDPNGNELTQPTMNLRPGDCAS